MFGLFGPPKKQEFASILMEKIKAAGGPSDFVYDEASFTLKRKANVVYLGHVHETYCQASKSEREAIILNFARGLQEKSDDVSFDEVRPHLVAVVRERVYFAFTALHWEIETDEKKMPLQLSRPVSRWFTTSVVIDAPGSMTFVTEENLKSWGIYEDEAFAIGLENLQAATSPKFSGGDGLFRGEWNDDFDSSRILLPGLFDDLPLVGDPVVVLPNRSTFLVAGAGDPQAIARMLIQAEEILTSKPRPQNIAPLLVKNDGLEEFTVPLESPIFNAVERARKLAAQSYYTEQKDLLEKLHEKSGSDLFVASHTLMKEKDAVRQFRSHSVWSRDVATLLPVADEIVFYDHTMPEGAQTVARCSWERVQSIVGDLMLDTQMFPARFYVSKFPSPEQLRMLNASQLRCAP